MSDASEVSDASESHFVIALSASESELREDSEAKTFGTCSSSQPVTESERSEGNVRRISQLEFSLSSGESANSRTSNFFTSISSAGISLSDDNNNVCFCGGGVGEREQQKNTKQNKGKMDQEE